jgi:hypothetical protein
MTLTLYRRHKKTCPNFGKLRRARQVKCTCMFWVDGVLGGHEVRKSLHTRDSKKANQKLHEWESKEQVVECGTAVTLADAWTSLIADLEARKPSDQTIRKYKLLQRQMKAYGAEFGLKMLAQFDLDVLSKFRATWKDGPRTAGKKLERLRTFFRFAHDRQWVESNPAVKIKLPKTTICPTMPLAPEQWLNLLMACDKFLAEAPDEGKLNALRLKTLAAENTIGADALLGNARVRCGDADNRQARRQPAFSLHTKNRRTRLHRSPRFRSAGAWGDTVRYGYALLWSGQGKRQPRSVTGKGKSRRFSTLPASQRVWVTQYRIGCATRLRSNSCKLACRLSASRFCSGIKVCASRSAITTRGCAQDRNNLRPMLPARGSSTHI